MGRGAGAGAAAGAAAAPGTYMEVRYEDLVADPEPLLRRIADFVDLPWDDGMLDYHHGAEERMKEVIRDFHPLGGGTITAEERKRQHELVKSPPSSSRVGRWRTEMSAEDREAFECRRGDLLHASWATRFEQRSPS